jgi:hypothetical protein
MELMTKEIEKAFAKQGDTSQKEAEEVKVIAKYFSCFNGWTWYATEYDPQTKIFFGYVRGVEDELGSFSLQEFEDINKEKGMSFIERDLYFGTEHTLAEAMKKRI